MMRHHSFSKINLGDKHSACIIYIFFSIILFTPGIKIHGKPNKREGMLQDRNF